ncbi:MAG: N-acetyl sugar amidotransferase [Acidimicrobiia bacterium]|nr:N-acetyl sugar amidotransferase [Acidimicrobiia bacterium]
MIQVCKSCVTPSTRPGIQFDDHGVCLPCRVAEETPQIDWALRREELTRIADWGREHTRLGYHCIVPVSGGKDSTRQALYARDDLGLRPLLVSCTYSPQQQSDVGAHNIANLIELGFDTIIVGPGPQKWKTMMKRAFYKYGNWCKATELALYSIPPRVAIAYRIPLIFLGENNAITYGDLGGSMGGDANRMKYNNTLSGGTPDAMMGDGITDRDVLWFRYPSDAEMAKAHLRVVYMGYFIEDFNQHTNARIAIERGLRVRETEPEDVGALNQVEDLDEDFVHVNQLLKFLKFGFARVTDEASQLVRLGMMTRDEAIDAVSKYDGRCHQRYIDAYCEFLGISVAEFWRVADGYRGASVWRHNPDGSWTLNADLPTAAFGRRPAEAQAQEI